MDTQDKRYSTPTTNPTPVYKFTEQFFPAFFQTFFPAFFQAFFTLFVLGLIRDLN